MVPYFPISLPYILHELHGCFQEKKREKNIRIPVPYIVVAVFSRPTPHPDKPHIQPHPLPNFPPLVNPPNTSIPETGSFGTYPSPVQTALRDFQTLAEASPDRFMRYTYSEHLLASRSAISQLVHAPLNTCVFVQNATLGINTVLRNLVYEADDVIVYFDTIYGACEKTILSILETNEVNVSARKVEGYEFPSCEHDEVVERFVAVVEELRRDGLRPRVAVFDTICALPGVRFPFERLTAECRRLGVLSCVDAAHGVGHIPLDLGALDPDFLVSNCHKCVFFFFF